jgi:hypothetical protein
MDCSKLNRPERVPIEIDDISRTNYIINNTNRNGSIFAFGNSIPGQINFVPNSSMIIFDNTTLQTINNVVDKLLAEPNLKVQISIGTSLRQSFINPKPIYILGSILRSRAVDNLVIFRQDEIILNLTQRGVNVSQINIVATRYGLQNGQQNVIFTFTNK